MTDEELEDRLRNEAVRLAAPVLKHEVPSRLSPMKSDSICEALWHEGYVPARELLLAEGVPAPQIEAEMDKVKALFAIVEPSDLISFPLDLHDELVDELKAEIVNEPPLTTQRLDERLVKEISDFRVEMWSNESQHAGRPHVKVHLKEGATSVSLDNEPENLTPRGGLVGEASALKVIKKHREKLLALWDQTRPDTQKLKKREQPKPPLSKIKKRKKR